MLKLPGSIFFIIFILSLQQAFAVTESFKVKILYCSDGDTCLIQFKKNVNLKIRLACIDAPEIGQKLSLKSKSFLNKKLQNRDVTLIQEDIDKYLRSISYIFLDNENINHTLIEKGLAEVYRGKTVYSKKECYKKELIAMSQKQGIWGLEKYISPKEYRKKR